VFAEEEDSYSYIETALNISMLLESCAVDFAVTGCSSGQGMMLACNSLPGILCGYVENPSDAYLFGRINDGNAISYPLGLNFGWAGEINLQSTLECLFAEPFGTGYPREDAARKQRDTKLLKDIWRTSKRPLAQILPELDRQLVWHALSRTVVFEYVMQHGKDKELEKVLHSLHNM
jgi:ribose 5-phosphate isomerase RpiB